LDDPNDCIPTTFDFGVEEKVEKEEVVKKTKRFEEEEEKKEDGSSEPKRRKRAKKDSAAPKQKQNVGECDRCRKHGQECDQQILCAYCAIGGYSCQRVPEKKAPKIVVVGGGRKRTSEQAAVAPSHPQVREEAPRCENCRKGHRWFCSISTFLVHFFYCIFVL
jgi:hypothetical protein